MEKHNDFSIGFYRTGLDEHMFLSVTPGFERGPGILRDGITKPRMTNPRHIDYVCHANEVKTVEPSLKRQTDDPYVQRAGTWTLYQHLKRFVETRGDKWRIVAVQSCGDLTMNPWHVAYLGKSHIAGMNGKLCALLTEEDRSRQEEPVYSTVYRALVKWTAPASKALGLRCPYEFLDIRLHAAPRGEILIPADNDVREEHREKFKSLPSYEWKKEDITGLIEFSICGKPVTENGLELSLSNLIDRFQDLRHVFNLPEVPCEGTYQGNVVTAVNFGEYQLFNNLNERRAALQSAVLIDLAINEYGGHVKVEWKKVREVLLSRHFREVDESPTKRGQFRRYPNSNRVEIFFPHNVYPFGVLGISAGGLVCLASGGLSGRVGNTLEGITRVMYDFFGCEDAIVLDEGYDTFQVINPHRTDRDYKYNNEQILEAVLRFTHSMMKEESAKSTPHEGKKMHEWLLNVKIAEEVERDFARLKPGGKAPEDILIVRPHRSQMRSAIIFAAEKESSGAECKPGCRSKGRGKSPSSGPKT